MYLRRYAGALLAAASLIALSTGSVAAAPPQPTAAYGGMVQAGPGATVVKIAYTCTSTPGTFNHLFVAVKQGPNVGPDYPNASSDFADTFYSTNWQPDAGPNALNCDGTPHVQSIVLKPQPGFLPKVPRLHSGPALVQICVYDNVTAVSDTGEPLDGGFAPSYTMENVRAGNGQG